MFKAEPNEGKVLKGEKKEILFYYYPRGKKAKNDVESIFLIIKNG